MYAHTKQARRPSRERERSDIQLAQSGLFAQHARHQAGDSTDAARTALEPARRQLNLRGGTLTYGGSFGRLDAHVGNVAHVSEVGALGPCSMASGASI